MALSKRLRYEVLRRDNHTCRYCGATAPNVKLTVDHVVPSALGGTDDPSNLVAACSGCNSGKAATTPDAPLVADVAADAVRWSAAIKQAAQDMIDGLGRRTAVYDEFRTAWTSWTDNPPALPGDWRASIDQFLGAGLPMPVLIECLDLAMGNEKVRSDNVFRYMCGIAWNRVSELQEAARLAVGPEDDEKPGEYPVLDILSECVIHEVVKAAGGDDVMAKLADQCMWQTTWAGAKQWKASAEAGADSSDTWDAAAEQAGGTAAYYLNAIAERARGEL
ncbi:HNH endonuclease [Amycolatopsis japonica]